MQQAHETSQEDGLDDLSMCEVLSVAEESVTLILRTSLSGTVDIRCNDSDVSYESDASLKLFPIDGLASDIEYTVCASTDHWERELHFRTLPRLEAKPLLTFAVVADPHISFGKPITHGRLFDKTRQLLNETVEDINAGGGIDLVVLPGDITEDGLAEEMIESRKILNKLRCEFVPVFGDHELYGNIPDQQPDPAEQVQRWCEVFEKHKTWFSHRHRDVIFIALDTDNGVICDQQLTWLEETLDSIGNEKIFVSCHRALVPDDGIDIESVSNSNEVMSLLERHGGVQAIFVGHKNVPSIVKAGNIWQVVCPQICEFPCGYLIVKLYENFWTHSFRPIKSETIMEESFQGCLNDGREQWSPGFRIGTPAGRNGVQTVR